MYAWEYTSTCRNACCKNIMKYKGKYVGRGGEKLKYAIEELNLDIEGMVGADFGCNIGGFTDCLLQYGVARVYAVDTGYGMLEWKLRCDDRVVVMERTNAMHIELPEKTDIVTIDVAWTPQRHILPSAIKQLAENGRILSLFKPQYEADEKDLRGGILPAKLFDKVLDDTIRKIESMLDVEIRDVIRLPRQKESKNLEAILHITPGDESQ